MTPEPTDIYQYSDPIEFLNAKFAEMKARRPKFSLRAWARAIGLSEATPLSLVLKRKRPLPLPYFPALVKTLKLTDAEGRYLEAILGVYQARAEHERAHWLRKAHRLSRKAASEPEWIDRFEFLQDPFLFTLIELVEMEGFAPTPEWVSARVTEEIDAAKLERSLKLLQALRLLRKDRQGRWVRTRRHVSSRHDLPSLAVKRFHETALRQAVDALYRESTEEREFGSYVIGVRRENLPEMKRKIRCFTREMIAQYVAAPGESDSIYHLNVNLFARTRTGAEEPASPGSRSRIIRSVRASTTPKSSRSSNRAERSGSISSS